jgi:hypothetical protein
MNQQQRAAVQQALDALEVVWREHKAIDGLLQLLEQPEPVFCEYCGGNDDADFGLPTDHCTDCARPQPAQPAAWVGLTTTERKEIERQSVYVEGAIRITEAKLREKNGGAA